ncbi:MULTISPECIES: hypothetical protein [Bradyrhizobium]|uniref:Transposase n=1 Tax=Bradyrhizobium brasilense TaxID=1419277 RepID=A0ABY8JFU0_9BRAD|nr:MULTISPECIES: hypothetical protein [Bradyrhizobium]MCP1846442.1 hypothetical protein [Bradyrhizobium sp. USDA 4541]MCP1910430.1 hypothetical protein [Bradyrhizobium elkanii]WFU63286.1 hypothetical protein QA636_38785 [Bradyrhizobium brasilense]
MNARLGSGIPIVCAMMNCPEIELLVTRCTWAVPRDADDDILATDDNAIDVPDRNRRDFNQLWQSMSLKGHFVRNRWDKMTEAPKG